MPTNKVSSASEKRLKSEKPKAVKDTQPKKRTRKRREVPLHEQLLIATTSFLNDLECARDMFNLVTPVLKEQDDQRMNEIDATIKKYKSIATNKKHKKEMMIGIGQFRILLKTLQQLNRSDKMFRCNSIVLMVARFDKFIIDVLDVYFKNQPALLKSNEKALTYSEVLDLNSSDSVLNILIEKEVDKLLRNSHYDLIEYLDTKLKIGIKSHFENLPTFIEITERRNLFVHTGNIVNRHYLGTCKQHNAELDSKIKEGSVLSVSNQYFEESFRCLFELGLRIGQSAVRRLFPDKIKEADDSLINDIGFPILQIEQWELSKLIFEFALKIPEKYLTDDRRYRLYLINLCICLKHLNKKKEMLELLDSQDWSSSNNDFILAKLLLKEEYKKAETLMSVFSQEEPFPEEAYRTWPIFLEFRKTLYFSRAFQKIYDKEFIPIITEEESEEIEKLKAADNM